MFANRLVELDQPLHALYRDEEIDETADRIVEGGRQFRDNVLNGFTDAGIDIRNPFEMLLAIRRVGSKRLEELFGPGKPAPQRLRGRAPVVRSHSIEQLEKGRRRARRPHEPGQSGKYRARRLARLHRHD